ncbi:MAG: hypothetical protein KAV42_03570 [Candidatus Krumholzibacteria bacterium]|nr:hypothetical protein [Candidatus Krumholzibacteria bacterium]
MHRGLIFIISTLCLVSLAGCGDNVVRPGGAPADPSIFIISPAVSSSIPTYPAYIDFGWQPHEECDIKCTRYLWSEIVDTSGIYSPGFDFIRDLNECGWRYENLWSEWECAGREPGGSGSFILGDDEELQLGRYHFFAVQAMDRTGNVTTTFTKNINVRNFMVKAMGGPFLKIYEPLLGGFRFLGTSSNPALKKIPQGIALEFRWEADASSYFGEIEGYRYGWDIGDIESWESPFLPGTLSTGPVTFNSGIHTLYIEVVDKAGNMSSARITVEAIPWQMDRNLLWVDDFASVNYPIPNYSWPPEYEHDSFWLDICSSAAGFDPSVDVFDCDERYSPPDIETIGRYKNLIWTYAYTQSFWNKIVLFIPESMISTAASSETNVISLFLRKGGHVWTLGRSDRGGGLAAVLGTRAQNFPLRLATESAGVGYPADGSGVDGMAYRDYCVSILDKVQGTFREHAWMPLRHLEHYDVFRYATIDEFDPVTLSIPGLPGRLDLREEISSPGSFFSFDTLSSPGGFTYVEVYDPPYWMDATAIASQHCFHPAYLMRAADEASALNGCPVAIWISRYEDILPEVTSGIAVAAPSLHFGFPLWFFRQSSVDSIATALFDLWGIGEE